MAFVQLGLQKGGIRSSDINTMEPEFFVFNNNIIVFSVPIVFFSSHHSGK